jgi:uncharacterized metal-binding protein
LKAAPVLGKTRAAKKVITVDGRPFECSRKITEGSGFEATKSIVLVRYIGMKKKPLHEDMSLNKEERKCLRKRSLQGFFRFVPRRPRS